MLSDFQRWAILPGGPPPESMTFGFGDMLITPMILYGTWQVILQSEFDKCLCHMFEILDVFECCFQYLLFTSSVASSLESKSKC